ncbi:MAG: PepSY1/2 domain-containing protein [Christensenellales bacterium]|jgi:spore germination protein
MHIEYEKRSVWRWLLPLILTVLLIAAIVVAATQIVRANDVENRLHGVYDKSFNEVTSDISSIDVMLSKLGVCTSAQQQITLNNQICSKTNHVQSLLGQLPVPHELLNDLSGFINRIGDFCHMLNQKLSAGEEMTDEDREQLAAIEDACAGIAADLAAIEQEGMLPYQEMQKDDYIETISKEEDNRLYKLSEEGADYPRLIYDGPFSESTMNKEPEGLTGKEVGQDRAYKAALEFLGNGAQLENSGEVGGLISAYLFQGTLANGTDVSVAMTKQGAHPFWMNYENTLTDEFPDEEQAQECARIAKKYIEDRGFAVQPTYSQFYSGVAVVNLAIVQEDVILYPDLIKVWVDITSKDVVGFDFRNYLMAHKQRELPEVMLSEEEAREQISGALEPEEEGRLALIPKEDNTEKLCYEFSGYHKDRRFIVYINAENGYEENIFLVIDTQNGTMVQ